MPSLPQNVGLPDRYRVVGPIADGGMASVWTAEDAKLERIVAIKILAPAFAAEPAARRRFTREARAAARVSDHPHVVTIFDIGDYDGTAFIVMEHFAGGTVAGRVRGAEPIAAGTALRWLEETASALDCAHGADIVHRDVKPANLLLDERGRLAVGDFGIASLAGEAQVTRAGEVLGTAAYLSPEQARGYPATAASDRFALGVVAYELLCGRRPFAGANATEQARARIAGVPAPPPAELGAAAGDALLRALAVDPQQRPVSAAALVAELRESLRVPARPPVHRTAGPEWHERPRFARESTPPPVPTPPGPGRRRLWRALSIAALVVVCLGLGAGAALITDNGNDGGEQGRRQAKRPTPLAHARAAAPTPAPRAAAVPPATATTPAVPASDTRTPSALNNAGFAMLPDDPADAVPLLRRAVDGFRASKATSDVDYAYALYNLGWALNLTGRHSEAIPYLEERLRISDFKRDVVEQELRTAKGAS